MPTAVQFSNQFASSQGHGIARYSREVVASTKAAGRWDIVPAAGWSDLPPADLSRLRAESGLELTGLGRQATKLLWTFAGVPSLESRLSQQVDLVHALSLGYPVATRKPFVVTVHDLGPLTHPEYFSNTRPWVMESALKQAERDAAAIVCVSHSTADEVRDVAGTSVADRLHVIHEGVSDVFFDASKDGDLSGLDLPGHGVPFILSAGKISPRKNVQGLLRAVRMAKDRIPHHLVMAGGIGWDEEVVERELSGMRDRVHFAGFVNDAQLRALYRRAAVYAHPSLYEGFGLTVLEAMAGGAPVIASDRTSLPEVVGDAGRLVDPDDDAALSDAIVEICSDDGLRARMRDAGIERARAFSWRDGADALLSLYDRVLA